LDALALDLARDALLRDRHGAQESRVSDDEQFDVIRILALAPAEARETTWIVLVS